MSPTSAFARPPEVRNAREAVARLADKGPHEVLRGDLGMVGVPGVVFAPTEGLGLPAVAFGHDWLQPVGRYAGLLRHLASWGIVVAAPDSQRGPLPSHARFAADLRTALEVCVGVRLGEGKISVDGRRTALAGHGIGGGAALLAAADTPRLAAVVTIAVAQTRPSALDAARRVTVPTLHIAAGRDTVSPAAGHAEPIAAAAGGPVWLRTLAQGRAHRVPRRPPLERPRAHRQSEREDPAGDPRARHGVPAAPPDRRGPRRRAGGRQGQGHRPGDPVLTARRSAD